VVPGKGKLQHTGQLGEVMQESIQAAMTVVRSRANVLGIEPDFYQKHDVHLHMPEGATPKKRLAKSRAEASPPRGSAIVAEVERNLRNEDQLLRFLTVKLGDAVDVEVSRQLAEERQRIRRARLEQLKLEEENEARWREGEEDEEQPVEEVVE